jgi:hypothetical protein
MASEGQRQGSPVSGDQEEAKEIAPGLQQHFPKRLGSPHTRALSARVRRQGCVSVGWLVGGCLHSGCFASLRPI